MCASNMQISSNTSFYEFATLVALTRVTVGCHLNLIHGFPYECIDARPSRYAFDGIKLANRTVLPIFDN